MTSATRAILTVAIVGLLLPTPCAIAQRPTNVLLVVADDLGYGELGCYGQEKIATPRIDALAKAGVRMTRAWSGAPVCAPSRCVMFTGKHTGHAAIRDNGEVRPEGQTPLPERTPNLFSAMRSSGRATACIGKWGLGPPGSSGDPLAIGVDRFYGYNCQRHAHSHEPDWLWNDRTKAEVKGSYAPTLMTREAVAFIETKKDVPWFLAFTSALPHLALQIPEEELKAYAGKFPETPYDGKSGYRPHATPKAAYAAMITHLDTSVGRLVDALKATGQLERTLIVFTSDNGTTHSAGVDAAYFKSTAGLRGLKGSAYEGGIRVPLILHHAATLPAGRVVDAPCAAYDLWPTIAAAVGLDRPVGTDGVDLGPVLRGESPAPARTLYMEFPGYGGWQAAVDGKWKIVRKNLKKQPDASFELYDLDADPRESVDVAGAHPETVKRLAAFAASARTPSPNPAWNW
ncbi:MAG: Arylsulfatase precursor [Planctomycetota bacterium]